MLMMPSTPLAFELFKVLIDSKISKVCTGKKKLELFNSGKLADNENFLFFCSYFFLCLKSFHLFVLIFTDSHCFYVRFTQSPKFKENSFFCL